MRAAWNVDEIMMQKKLFLSAVAALAVAISARTVRADEATVSPSSSSAGTTSDDDSPRYPPSSVRWKLILGGVGLSGLAYGATLASSFIWPDVPGHGAMRIPIVGPWIALGQNGCAADSPDCGAILYVRGALEVVSGIVQASGLGLIGEGIFMTTEAEGGKKPRSAQLRILPMPIVTPTTTGLGIVGTF